LANDTTFKYLFKNPKIRPFFEELIKYYTGLDISDFNFIDNELNSGNIYVDYRLDSILTNSNESNVLFGSDGTQKIYRLNCSKNLNTISFNEVKYDGKILPGIGDMAFVNGFIYANIYGQKKIVKINTSDFTVVKTFDLGNLVDFELKKGFFTQFEYERGKVLNGIAYDKKNDNFLVTGKQWGNFYIIKFNE
jgi:glutamine cyclotransferase